MTPPTPHDPDLYGAAAARSYDALYAETLDTGSAVGCLRALAGSGPVLEFGVGTGRLALPLADHGLEVHGVELSSAMIEELRRKDRAGRIQVTRGDFAATRVEGSFSLVFIVFNTIFAAETHHDQLDCFRNAFRHLRPDGLFVIEAMIFNPDESGHRGVRPRHLSAEHVELEAFRWDPTTQRLETTLIHLGEDGIRLIPANHCYAGPDQIDAMGRAAGFQLHARWGGWDEGEFTGTSERHISVYRRPAASGDGSPAQISSQL
jgi:SAM-dependent methyltransferase